MRGVCVCDEPKAPECTAAVDCVLGTKWRPRWCDPLLEGSVAGRTPFLASSPTPLPVRTRRQVLKPSQDREDASMRGDAVVVGEKLGPPGTPTVLFYASYGTVDESSALKVRSGGAKENVI